MAGRPKGLPKSGGRKAGTPNKATAEIKTLAQQYGVRALQRVVALMVSEDERVSLSACQEILSRAYGKPPQPQTGEGGEGPVKLEVTWAVLSAS
jgi:hypothetical protein